MATYRSGNDGFMFCKDISHFSSSSCNHLQVGLVKLREDFFESLFANYAPNNLFKHFCYSYSCWNTVLFAGNKISWKFMKISLSALITQFIQDGSLASNESGTPARL